MIGEAGAFVIKPVFFLVGVVGIDFLEADLGEA